MWTESVISAIKRAEGSIQDIAGIPDDIKAIYRTSWELPMRSLIDMGAARGAYIDQSQSLNLFMESPTIGKLSSMYLHAWKQGLKTTYYLRSRPATRINKANAGHTEEQQPTPTPTPPSGGGEPSPIPTAYSDVDAVACSLENPESCEACQ
jgi:ribonucleoside-diphosphate reductase alpha chain